MKIYFDYLEIIMTIIFTTEVAAKIMAFGFFWCGQTSYMRSIWNAIDFFIVGASLISLTLPG